MEVVAFAVDHAYRSTDAFQGLPLVDFESVGGLYPPREFQMFVALSYAQMNTVRAAKYAEAKRLGYSLVSYVSSRCTFLSEVKVGDNCFILEDNTIQPFSRIGSDVTLWSGNHIGHDSTIEDHCFISSHVVVPGHVTVGAYSFIGVNATLRDSITIAESSLIGAGAVVLKSTVAGGVYLARGAELFGRPSREMKL
jgi:sugar O-acyltransferase (sialic acid O-acetyltransferase NeuD family)